MLHDKVKEEQNLEQLLHELDQISGDLSSYVSFLAQRRYLIQQVMADGLFSNN